MDYYTKFLQESARKSIYQNNRRTLELEKNRFLKQAILQIPSNTY